MKKKILLMLMALLSTIFIYGCASQDNTQGMTDQEIITQAVTNTYTAESVLIRSLAVYSTQSSTQPVNAQVTGETKIFAEPFMISNRYLVENITLDTQEEFKTYINIMDDQLMGYVLQNNEWFRAANLLDPDHLNSNPLNNLFLFLNNPSTSDFLVEDDQNNELDQTKKYILSADAGIYEILLSQSLVSLGIAPYVVSPEALEALGDFEMAVWIDKESLMIKKMVLDFSPNLRRLGDYLATREDVPENISELFRTFSYEIQYSISDHNRVSSITIPLEARVGTKLD